MLYIVNMHEVDLRQIDLNLLVVLDVLLEERNVTRTAARLGMSQPAASRALARLRSTFADALLVEGPGGYLLSVRAEELRADLKRTLSDIGHMLSSGTFDAAKATGRVRLLMPDLQAATLAPYVLARLATEAPMIDLEIGSPGSNPIEAIEAGSADAVIGLIDEAPAGIQRRRLYDESLVTLMRADHPAATNDLTLDRFMALEHIVVSVTGSGPAPMDEALAKIGRMRRVRLRVPNFLAAVEIAARSDLVMTLPQSLARTAADMRRFVALPPPIDLGIFTMSLAWHARQQDAPRHIWLRRAIVAATSEATAVLHSPRDVA